MVNYPATPTVVKALRVAPKTSLNYSIGSTDGRFIQRAGKIINASLSLMIIMNSSFMRVKP